MSQVSLGRPEFVPGTPPGHPTAKFLYVIFLYRFFFLSLITDTTGESNLGTGAGWRTLFQKCSAPLSI